jgi:aminopeptidase YwaD
MLRKALLLLLFLLFYYCGVQSQSCVEYARNIVDTMASEQMQGRGYLQNGDKLAANYLRSQFQKQGLNALQPNYYQLFNLSVNTFPFDLKLIFDHTELIAGRDYIVHANSNSFSGTYPVIVADDALLQNKRKWKSFLKKKHHNKIVLINDTGKVNKELQELLLNKINAKAIVVLKDKLTWSVARDTAAFCTIEVLRKNVKTIPSEISIDVFHRFVPNYISQNVMASIKGKTKPDSFIVFTAHYDHLGKMGDDIYFAGANDNASGCAMLLSLAQFYAQAQNQPDYSILFIAFGAEEAGLVGSTYFVEHPIIQLQQIKFLLNMDIVGTGNEGITVVNATEHLAEFDVLKSINAQGNYFSTINARGKAANSDHYPFSQKKVKSFFIYTLGGIKAYHDIDDRSETLPLTKFEDLFTLIIKFSQYLQHQPPY